MNYTVDELKNIREEALNAARIAATEYFNNKLGGQDQYACGFAWVDICGIKASTKLGRALKAAGFRKAYNGAFQIWNPSGLSCQNIDTKEQGAIAAALVFKKYGFEAYSGSRLD